MSGKKLGRTTPHRLALFRNMVTSLVEKEKIETTLHKAKELVPLADRMITLGKKGDLWARRQAAQIIRKKDLVKKLFSELAPRFGGRNGGFTRILKLGYRLGDSAPMAIIEYLPEEGKKTETAKSVGKKGKK